MPAIDILFLCTGNAARSVMAGAALSARLSHLAVATAGTLAIDGQPMSWRTRQALERVGLVPPVHRSRQASSTDLDRAALVIGLAPEHVAWVRRTFPHAVARTATLARLARDLRPGPEPLCARVVALGLEAVELEPWEEVIDPGGGDAPEFDACARRIVDLVEALTPALNDTGPAVPPQPRSWAGART